MSEDLCVDELSKLDSKKLAQTLWEHAQIDDALYKKCELLLTYKEKDKLAGKVKRRLSSLKRSTHFYHRGEAREFSGELDYIRQTILNGILPKSPELAAQLFETFLLCGNAIMNRVDDSYADVSDVFKEVVTDWAAAWEKIETPDRLELADKIFEMHMNNGFGIHDEIINKFSKTLGSEGLEYIQTKLQGLKLSPKENNFRNLTIRIGLKNIAEIKQDMEMYIKYKTDGGKVFNGLILNDIVEHFLEYGKTNEAIEWLTKYQGTENEASKHDQLMLLAHQNLGNDDEVRDYHWKLFGQFLSNDHFEAVIKLSTEKEQLAFRKKAIEQAISYVCIFTALNFLIEINEFGVAAKTLHLRYDQVDGQAYYHLIDTAKSFEAKGYYLEAILIYRRLAESILDRALSKSYHHAVKYLNTTVTLADKVSDWQHYPAPQEYMAQIRKDHARKSSFWAKYESNC